MLKATRLAVPVLLAVMVLAPVAPALAAPAAPVINHDVTEDMVFWTLPAGQCPNLPADQTVIGFGDRVITTDITTYDDGSRSLSLEITVTGEAMGTDGTEYTFYSIDHLTGYNPGDGTPAQFRMHDLFLLQSPAAAAQNTYVLRSAFDWRWTLSANDAALDWWPPADLQTSTNYGEPVDGELESVCDPL